MPIKAKQILIAAVVIAAFFTGVWYAGARQGMEPKPLYYACPMHPAYRAERPGDAPCCGMRLEPVFAESTSNGTGKERRIHLSAVQQQLGGVRIARVTSQKARGVIRTAARVAADENRLYRINASTEMWIRKIQPPATGTPVSKDELLCAFYTTNFLTAAQSYIYILNAADQLAAAGQTSTPQLASNELQLRQAAELLQNLGVPESQIEEMRRTRKASALVEIRSPVAGYVLTRSVSLGQWVAPGTELYQIADLSRVWVYADLYESDSRRFRGGEVARAWSGSLRRWFEARVSDVPPSFDAATRQVRVRLEVNNPDRALWPGMFVDVEVPAENKAGLAAPADAIVYSGTEKRVYVSKGGGVFEPRVVETGWTAGDLVEITKGVAEGENVVAGATFLLDSESRMRQASRAEMKPVMAAAKTVKDPVCGMEVDPSAATLKSEYRGKTYYFCGKACKTRFDRDPEKVPATR